MGKQVRTIVSLQAENIKRLLAVKISPDGHVILGGDNGAGKSSVLDSIQYAIGGKGAIPAAPLRDGEEEGKIVLALSGDDSLTITRTFSEDGKTTLTVEDSNGKLKRPQEVLDALYGKLTFDPVAFQRMAPSDQAEALRVAAGIDLTEIEDKIGDLFAERRDANRDVKQLKAQFEGLPVPENMPVEKVDISGLVAAKGQYYGELGKRERLSREQVEADFKVAGIVEAMATAREALKVAAEMLLEARSEPEIKTDIGRVENSIERATVANAAYEAGHAKRSAKAAYEAAQQVAADADAEVTNARERKARIMSSIKLPIDGLSLTDDGVMLHGLPFDQASQAEQLRTSAAIGMADNPGLRVMMVRDGSLLDEKSLEMLCDMATAADYHLWCERVGEDSHTTVVIEDGMVRPTCIGAAVAQRAAAARERAAEE
jgi:hypothetical protein